MIDAADTKVAGRGNKVLNPQALTSEIAMGHPKSERAVAFESKGEYDNRGGC